MSTMFVNELDEHSDLTLSTLFAYEHSEHGDFALSCSLTNSMVITTIMYGTKIMYLNPESLLR